MRWGVAGIAGMLSILSATYWVVHGGIGREECLAGPVAGCLLDLAEEGLAGVGDENAQAAIIRDIAVARARAGDFDAAFAAAVKLQDERSGEVLLEIAEEQGRAGQSDAATATIESVLDGIDGRDTDLKGRAAITFGTIGNAPSALRVVHQISDDIARKDTLASVYFALAELGQIEFADYLAKFDFTGDDKRLEAHVTRLAELADHLAGAGRIEAARSVLKAARRKGRPVLSRPLLSALTAATLTIEMQMGRYDAAIRLAKMSRNLPFRAKYTVRVAKAASKSGGEQISQSTLDDLLADVGDVPQTMSREPLLAYVATAYVVSGYPEKASDIVSEISMNTFRALAYGAAARGLLDVGQTETAQVYLDLAVNELEGLQRGSNEDAVVRGVADQLARADRAKQALKLMLGISDTPADISRAYVSLARGLSVNTNAISPGETKAALGAWVADGASWVTRIVPKGKSGEFQHGSYPSFGDRTHVGYDIAAPCGSEIRASNDGTIVDAIASSSDRHFNTLGYMVLIQHAPLKDDRPVYSLYLNMFEPPAIREGAVKAGEVIGKVGKTGLALSCHLHFEIRHFEGRFHPGWVSFYGQGDQRDSAEFQSDWSDPAAWDPFLSTEAVATMAEPAAVHESSQPATEGSGEANRLFVEAVQLYRQAVTRPEAERLALYRRVLANIDRILNEFGKTDIAQRIDSGAPLGLLDLQEVRLVVGNVTGGGG